MVEIREAEQFVRQMEDLVQICQEKLESAEMGLEGVRSSSSQNEEKSPEVSAAEERVDQLRAGLEQTRRTLAEAQSGLDWLERCQQANMFK